MSKSYKDTNQHTRTISQFRVSEQRFDVNKLDAMDHNDLYLIVFFCGIKLCRSFKTGA